MLLKIYWHSAKIVAYINNLPGRILQDVIDEIYIPYGIVGEHLPDIYYPHVVITRIKSISMMPEDANGYQIAYVLIDWD
jgi:hypothetical protein